MHASYRGLSYKCALDVWSSSVSLYLEFRTVDVVAACKAFQVAIEAVRVRNTTTAITVVLYSRYHSRTTLVEWLGHVTLRYHYRNRDQPPDHP